MSIEMTHKPYQVSYTSKVILCCDHEMKLNYCDFFIYFFSLLSTSVMQPCENLQETILLWFADLDHMFALTFASALQLINHPFIPGNAETFSQLAYCPVKESSY